MTGFEQIGIALLSKLSVDQIMLGVFGVSAIRLSQDARERVRRWAGICGLCAQPAWFYTTYTHEQWGIFLLSFFYTWAWWKGVRTYWLKGAS